MSTKIFVNLPVKNLDRAKNFFSHLGMSFDPQFSDDKAACLVISDDIYAMLLTEPFFSSFTAKDIADTSTATEAIVSLEQESKAEVDRIGDAAVEAGAKVVKETTEQSPMYTRSFYDPDGHHWEIFTMDRAAMKD